MNITAISQKQTVALQVNSKPVEVVCSPLDRLSDVLRNQLKLTGTKIGCDAGDCGACTVLMDGDPICACLTAIAQVENANITTVEGLTRDGVPGQLQQSFLAHGAAQCGFCTPGMLVSASALLAREPEPTREQTLDALGGVLCRCTGYEKIIKAVMQAGRSHGTGLMPEAGKAVGAAVRHLDGVAKVTGDTKFGSDDLPKETLFVRVIRSPYHHARFSIGDREAFLASHPGCELFLDHSDIPGLNCHGVIPAFADQPVFAEGIARFKGEAVAAVVGEASAINTLEEDEFPVTWEALPHLLEPETAHAPGAALLHNERPDNVLTRGYVERGDTKSGLASAAHAVTVTISTPFVEHAYLEPEAGYAVRKGNRVEVHGCTQAAVMNQESLAAILGVELEALRIVPSACGGGFGSKLDLSYQPYIALAAWKLNRPVALCYSRGESMRSTTKRHPSKICLTAACDGDGKLSALEFEGTFNTGAYASWGPTVANRVPVHASGPYYVPNYRANSVAIHTNGPASGAFRGFGVPQSAIAQETAFDQLADKVGIDRLAFRLKNALRNGLPAVTGQVFESGVGIVECLEAVSGDWHEAREQAAAFNAENSTVSLRKGVGLASCWYGCGNTSLPNPSTMRIGITADGRIVLHQGAIDIGQGANTVIAQIAADAIGVQLDAISLIGADTDLTPDCGKTSASRQTFVSGKAAKLAGDLLRTRILKLGNVGPNAEISIVPGRIELRDGSDSVAIELAQMETNAQGYVLMAEETYDPPVQPLDEKGQGIPYAQYGYGVQMVELTVDTALGSVRLDRITTAHDVGRAVNPMLVEGQIEGGIAQGIGMALMEEYIPGRTENLHDYLIPTIGDMPRFRHHLVEVPDPEGAYGIKGLGEHVLIPTAPAILNAIRDACGAVVSHLPATPDKVLAAIAACKKEACT